MSRIRTELEAALNLLRLLPDTLADLILMELGRNIPVLDLAPMLSLFWSKLSPSGGDVSGYQLVKVAPGMEVFNSPLPYKMSPFMPYDVDEDLREYIPVKVEEIRLIPIYTRNELDGRIVVFNIGAGHESRVIAYWTEHRRRSG